MNMHVQALLEYHPQKYHKLKNHRKKNLCKILKEDVIVDKFRKMDIFSSFCNVDILEIR